jgi:phage-related protein
MWNAWQYKNAWDGVYGLCDEATRDLLDRRLFLLREKGNLSERPISAPLGSGVFELRANTARMLFVFGPQRAIVFVNCLIKKVNRIPPEEIALAKKRRSEIEKGKVKPNALPD